MSTLLSRDAFRAAVFERDGGRCVVCGEAAADAHHILERRLFPDGGYRLDNGASLCSKHHLEAEMTAISVERLRELIGILAPVIPPQLDPREPVDKWGNPVLPDGRRLRGELFHEEGVQRVLQRGGMLSLFTYHLKYPRTYHLPWSPGLTKDDRLLESTSAFEDQEVVATVKMDGENISMYRDHIHARSLEFRRHESRSWIRAFHAERARHIPEGWRVCGESLFARHSIHYRALPSYFLGFSVWDETNACLPWDETLEYFELLDILPVPTLYRGPYDEQRLRELYSEDYEDEPCEGYVVRRTDGFSYRDFRRCVAKFVRADHVQTDRHWLRQVMVPNGLAAEREDLPAD